MGCDMSPLDPILGVLALSFLRIFSYCMTAAPITSPYALYKVFYVCIFQAVIHSYFYFGCLLSLSVQIEPLPVVNLGLRFRLGLPGRCVIFARA